MDEITLGPRAAIIYKRAASLNQLLAFDEEIDNTNSYSIRCSAFRLFCLLTILFLLRWRKEVISEIDSVSRPYVTFNHPKTNTEVTLHVCAIKFQSFILYSINL